MEIISKGEMLTCALVSELPYSKLSDVIKEACEHQLEADQKAHKAVIREIKTGLEGLSFTKRMNDTRAPNDGYWHFTEGRTIRDDDWQEFWQKYGGIK